MNTAVRSYPAPAVASGVAKAVFNICRAACAVCGVSEHEFHGNGRHPLVVRARRLAILAVRRNTRASYPEIRAATGTWHTTWIDRHAIGSISLQVDPHFARQLAEVEAIAGMDTQQNGHHQIPCGPSSPQAPKNPHHYH